ncbi:Zn-binding domain-containing protein [Nocardioides sp. NPDC047086]|uniref:Zn-binding domain-containing protein n=1 Tax=Nocardioides sp. NPDC047086 TaxID=3154810 RepID=UPI0033C15682
MAPRRRAALDDGSAKRLREWATRTSGPLTSELAERLVTESQRWRHDLETVAFRIAETEKELPALERQANSPAATEEDKHHFQSANAALRLARKHRADLQGEYWIAVAERAGLLPNYTLMDDSVTLDVALRWMDPESGAYETDSLDYHRNAALALREFAPRARFYARGYRVEIDAVDLGAGGEAVRTYAFCPVCGFRADVTSEAAPSACPRCAADGMADVRQRLDVVELTRASSVMRRDEAGIDDSSDERERVAFDERFIADIDPAKVTRQWYVADYGFGVKHLRNMDLTWLNLGRRAGHGSTKVLGGHEVDAELFRVCGECGKLDQEMSRNSRYEHRPWCRLRESADENAVSIALSRSLVTEGLVLRLPPMTSTGNAFAVPSLEAALNLGLREHIGGAPDHLSVESVVDTDIVDGHGGLVYDALLLHDLVTGGTGYLIDLAEPSMMRTVLQQALAVVAGCSCGEDGRLACHRCLLPFARPGNARLVSRSEAERLLGDLLRAGTNEPLDSWTVTDVPVVSFDPESKMEQLFRKRLVERLGVLGATVKEHPSTHGIRYDINVGGRHWSLDPQVQMGHTQPDFVLRTADPNILPMVIYCDGWRWHASPKTNRIAEDAENRRILRESGNLVVGLSWTDLEMSGEQGQPSWYDAGTVIGTANQMNVGLRPEHADVIGGSAMDLIIWWIQSADLAGLQAIGKVLPFLVAGPAQLKGDAGSGDLTAAAVDLLAGKGMTGSPSAWAWCEDTLVWLNRFDPTTFSTDVVLVLDDETVGPDHKEAWRSWLRYSNLLGARTTGTAITARTLAGATGAEILPEMVEGPKVDAVWGPVLEMATPSETALLNALRDAGVDQVPELGHEVGGVPVFAFVDDRIVVDVDGLDEEDRNLLAAEGWQVVSASLDEIQAALNGVSR